MAGRSRRKCRARLGGVQVEDGVHAGLADGVEVHEVAVVGDEVFVGAERSLRGRSLCCRLRC